MMIIKKEPVKFNISFDKLIYTPNRDKYLKPEYANKSPKDIIKEIKTDLTDLIFDYINFTIIVKEIQELGREAESIEIQNKKKLIVEIKEE